MMFLFFVYSFFGVKYLDNFRITVTAESGLIELWDKEYSTKAKFCKIIHPNEANVALNKPLTIYDLIGLFYIVLIGLTVSLVLLITEILLKQLGHKLSNDLRIRNIERPSTMSFTLY